MKLFDYNKDIYKTAILNWNLKPHEHICNMNMIAKGYFKSALLLANDCLNDNSNHNADLIIFPMLFSVNHAIELYEKSLYLSLNILLKYKAEFPENHEIVKLWNAVKGKIYEFGFNYSSPKDEFEKMIKPLETYLKELSSKIILKEQENEYFNIDFTRYPLQKNMKDQHFYLQTYDNVVVDLESFVEIFTKIYDCLDSLSSYYYEIVYNSWQSE